MNFSISAIQQALVTLGYLGFTHTEGVWDGATGAAYAHAAANDNLPPWQHEQPANLEQCTPSVRKLLASPEDLAAAQAEAAAAESKRLADAAAAEQARRDEETAKRIAEDEARAQAEADAAAAAEAEAKAKAEAEEAARKAEADRLAEETRADAEQAAADTPTDSATDNTAE